jgi:uncharacterized protein (DUF58 family)
MTKRTNLLVLILVLGVGVLLTYLLFFRFHIIFIFLLFPLIWIGSILSRLFRPLKNAQSSRGSESMGQENRERSYPEKQKEFYKKDYKVYGEDEEETGNNS